MPAYIIARVHAEKPELLKEYADSTPPALEKYHGKYLARGGKTVTLEGPAENRRIVIIEFPTLEDAEIYYHSPEYAESRKLREGIAVAEFIAIDGC